MNPQSTTEIPAQSTAAAREIQRRMISLYDLSASDNSGLAISQPLLRGPNYEKWATNFRQALVARKKYSFIDGSIPLPAVDSGDCEYWITINALIMSWIKITIKPSVRSNISNHDVAKDMWEHIKSRYSVKNGQRVQRLKAELVMTRQKGLTIESYFGKMMQLWTSLADHRQGQTVDEIAREREEDRVHELLMGLDEAYFGAVKSNILSRHPLPTLDEVYQILVQDEDAKGAARVFDDRLDIVAFAAQTLPRPQQQLSSDDKAKLLCTSCNRHGHLPENCFRTLGYPSWWVDDGL